MNEIFFMNRYYVYDLLKLKVVAYVACVVAYVAYDKAFLWLYLGILITNYSAPRQCLGIIKNNHSARNFLEHT